MQDKSKIFVFIFAILFLASGFFAYRFYSDYQSISSEYEKSKKEWSEERESLEKRVFTYKRQLQEERDKTRALKEEMARLQKEIDDWRQRYEKISSEKEALLEKLKEVQARKETEVPSQKVVPLPEEGRDVFWAQIVKERAVFQARAEELERELEKMKHSKEELQKQYENLKLDLDTAKAQLEELKRKLDFNKRTIEILSQELVREKDDKRSIAQQIEKFREDNLNLKREVKRLTALKEALEKDLLKAKEEKMILARRVEEMETQIKSQHQELTTLKDKIEKTAQLKTVKPQETKAVELPPIVVTPKEEKPVSKVEGKIIAVNKEQMFVIIDLGQLQGISAGMSLGAYRNDVKIADLKVIEVRKEISACDIVSLKPDTDLKVGDIVR